MADTDGGAATNPQGSADGQSVPQLRVITQFIKDLSFENPNVPHSLAPSDSAPDIGVNVDVRVKALAENDFEVDLQPTVDAKVDGKQLFLIELLYGGVFRVVNMPDEHMQPLLLIECPRLLFPFARRVVSDITRDGGFPPLMIDPIDFVALYRQQMENAQAEAAAKGGPDA